MRERNAGEGGLMKIGRKSERRLEKNEKRRTPKSLSSARAAARTQPSIALPRPPTMATTFLDMDLDSMREVLR